MVVRAKQRLEYHQSPTEPRTSAWRDLYLRTFYFMTSTLFPPSLPKGTRKRSGRSDSIRSFGFAEDHKFNLCWLKAARRILKPDGTA